MTEFERKQLKLYEREVEARERQADALEVLGSRFFVGAHNNLNIDNIAEALACVAMFTKKISDTFPQISDTFPQEIASALQEIASALQDR